ncbi:stage III sporulation protein AC [Anaerosalibacter bizertensis]|uniref:Stage III sporulation protein AC n=1 Tax=Anaerosalibacter bizertensis TaxID=932217 RepID=A0A844FFX2_9FIRM|nr:stage III sporulation protein AC [Anaerosalibacter bizertensis]MBV1819873.1 stage III sporulation protein AC [Bacteroidales bacterium MSK.15.36]MCB5558463.1 stage III sporulation protein AC [Anaerosalibacter bizertensis]MCG4564227.1 stage III sporulation protein AC [Anaerosalibacter bizertensis]MCG4583160.1 stage III sporulation protein AC [Anaerosalibacter bizertensis]MCG4584724.1 stage III sporulation protein AC [Anaerosalibacter bizertensis]
MDVDLIFKIASIGILSAVLHTVLARSGKEEYAYLASLAGVVIVLGVVINLISKLFDNVKSLFQLY